MHIALWWIFVVGFFMKVHSNSTMPINISINIKMDVPSNIIVLGKSTYIKDRDMVHTPVILLKYCDFLLLHVACM